mmetsp:Transcript_55373/g.161637  ORF Transcript_55373/g.161637 Transcript_55373/m.161637 type:complete len:296 (-) Transcript_55373:238-1125(-)
MNQCSLCKVTHASIELTRRHMEMSMFRGFFKGPGSRYVLAPQVPSDLTCRICQQQLHGVDHMHFHILQHLSSQHLKLSFEGMDGWGSPTAPDSEERANKRTHTANGAKTSAEGTPGARHDKLEKLTILQAKQTLINTQRLRMLEGIIVRTWVVPVANVFHQVGSAARKVYGERVANNPGHSEGQPDHHVWRALVQHAIQVSSAEDKQELERHWSTADAEKVQRMVLLCQFTKAFKSGEKKLEMTFHPMIDASTGDAFSRALATTGVKEKPGRAPRGGIERELEELITSLGGFGQR